MPKGVKTKQPLKISTENNNTNNKNNLQSQDLKDIRYNISHIPPHNFHRYLHQEDIFFLQDMLVDFKKHREDIQEGVFSSWNLCNTQPIFCINHRSNVLAVAVEPTQRFSKEQLKQQIQLFKNYPNKQLNSFMHLIDTWIAVQQQILHQIFSDCLNRLSYLSEIHPVRMVQFDNLMNSVYEQMSNNGRIYLSTHSSVDFNTLNLICNRFVLSESLTIVLGKTLEEHLNITMHNGNYDFYNFEGQIQLNESMLKERISIFKEYLTGIPGLKKKQPPKKLSEQLKIFGFDGLVFYADVYHEVFRLSEFLGEEIDQQPLFDFYSDVFTFEISPGTLKEIIRIREGCQVNGETEQSDSRFCFDYSLQSEIFIEKYLRNYERNLKENMGFYGETWDNSKQRCGFKLVKQRETEEISGETSSNRIIQSNLEGNVQDESEVIS